MDLWDNLVLLFADRGSLNGAQKAFIGVQFVIGIFVVVFLGILVLSPETYNLNAAGVWMSKIAFFGLLITVAMTYAGGNMVKAIAAKKAALAAAADAAAKSA